MFRVALTILPLVTCPLWADELFGTDPLQEKEDFATKMVRGIDAYLTRELQKSPLREKRLDVREARQRLRHLLGIRERRIFPSRDLLGDFDSPVKIGESENYEIFAVRWIAFEEIESEGLLIEPKGQVTAQAIIISDSNQYPEDLIGLTNRIPPEQQIARILAELRVRMIIPALINRDRNLPNTIHFDRIGLQTSREFLHRAAYQMGRTLIGYEVQKVFAAGDYLRSKSMMPIGLIGFREGAVIAFYTAALDSDGNFKSLSSIGYVGPLPNMWKEDYDHQIWGILKEFHLTELWDLLWPKDVCIGYSESLTIPDDQDLPLNWTAPKRMPLDLKAFQKTWSDYVSIESKDTTPKPSPSQSLPWQLSDHSNPAEGIWRTLTHFLWVNSVPSPLSFPERLSPIKQQRENVNVYNRNKRLFRQILRHIQDEWQYSDPVRFEQFEKLKYESRNQYITALLPLRNQFHEEVIGKLPPMKEKMNPRSRFLYETPKWTAYEVTLEMYDDVFASGVLLMPKGVKTLEYRPVIVCCHGANARPSVIHEPGSKIAVEHAFGTRLADLGFIVFAPLDPTFTEESQILQRKAHLVKLSMMSFIVRQHERFLEWLPTLPHVDGKNIGIYGFAVGGRTALRVPAILTKYKYVICSGEFTEAIGKAVSIRDPDSLVFRQKNDLFEFNLGNTFSHAEMAYMIAPRPFMVERAHDDTTTKDEQVAYEFSKVEKHYSKRLHIADRIEIEYFDGPRRVNGKGTFDFIRKHSGWPIIDQ